MKDADEVFAKVGIVCKGWTFDGEDPPEEVSGGDPSIGVAGLTWFPKLDVICVNFPRLHFGRIRRGRLDEDVPQFTGEFGRLNSFVPQAVLEAGCVQGGFCV